MLRVSVIFAFARSAMPVLQTLLGGASACLISAQGAMALRRKRLNCLVVPIWVGREHRATRDSPVGDFALARVKFPLTRNAEQTLGRRDEAATGEGDRGERAFSVGATGKVGCAQAMLKAVAPGGVEACDIGSKPAFAAGKRRPVIGKIGEFHPYHQ